MAYCRCLVCVAWLLNICETYRIYDNKKEMFRKDWNLQKSLNSKCKLVARINVDFQTEYFKLNMVWVFITTHDQYAYRMCDACNDLQIT